jgi:hypothetical protein
MCTDRKGVKDLPISAQGLPAVRRAGLPTVFFIRRSPGGLEGLPAVLLAGLTPTSFSFFTRSSSLKIDLIVFYERLHYVPTFSRTLWGFIPMDLIMSNMGRNPTRIEAAATPMLRAPSL